MSRDGTIVGEKKFSTNAKVLEAWARSLPGDAVYAIEAGTPTKRLYWALKRMGRDVRMAHPAEVRRMMGTKKKTDREDSAFLAELLRMGHLPEAYVPEPEDDEKRQLLRYRMDLGKKSTVVKNQVHALLSSAGADTGGHTDLFGRGGRALLRDLELPRQQRYLLDCHLRQLALLSEQIGDVERELARMAIEDPVARRLMEIKGVDFYSALVILNEIGDVTRFPTAKHLTSYAGLVPRVYQSGDVARTGHIHKQGPRALRAMLVSCANAAVKGPCKFQRLYRRLKKRIGHGKAVVAVARKMLAVIFVLLTRQCDYDDRDDGNVRKKISRMRYRARELPEIDLERTIIGMPEGVRRMLKEEHNSTMTG